MGSSTARALVKQISKQHGYLGEEVLSRMDPDVRREVEEAMLKKDAMIGSSVITYDQFLINSSCFLTGFVNLTVLRRTYTTAPLASSSNFFRTLTITHITLRNQRPPTHLFLFASTTDG
jgi:hypothetical protein